MKKVVRIVGIIFIAIFWIAMGTHVSKNISEDRTYRGVIVSIPQRLLSGDVIVTDHPVNYWLTSFEKFKFVDQRQVPQADQTAQGEWESIGTLPAGRWEVFSGSFDAIFYDAAGSTEISITISKSEFQIVSVGRLMWGGIALLLIASLIVFEITYHRYYQKE